MRAGQARLLTAAGLLTILATLGLVLHGQARRDDEPDPGLTPATAGTPDPLFEPVHYPTPEEQAALFALRPLAQRAFGPEARAAYDVDPDAESRFVVVIRDRAAVRAETIEALRVELEEWAVQGALVDGGGR